MLLHATTCYYKLLHDYYRLLHVTSCYYRLLQVIKCYYKLIQVSLGYYSYIKILQVNTCYYILLKVTSSDYCLNCFLQIILSPFTGSALVNSWYLEKIMAHWANMEHVWHCVAVSHMLQLSPVCKGLRQNSKHHTHTEQGAWHSDQNDILWSVQVLSAQPPPPSRLNYDPHNQFNRESKIYYRHQLFVGLVNSCSMLRKETKFSWIKNMKKNVTETGICCQKFHFFFFSNQKIHIQYF